ncbi:MAG: hypothetical protein ACWGNB_01035 [Thiogranum sp.]
MSAQNTPAIISPAISRYPQTDRFRQDRTESFQGTGQDEQGPDQVEEYETRRQEALKP